MKERNAIPLWLLDSGLIVLALLGALSCLASSFGVTTPSWLMVLTAVLTPLLNLLFRLKHGRWIALGALAVMVGLAMWQSVPLLAGALRLWQEIAGHYIRAYAWITEFYTETEGPVSYLPGLTAVVVLQIYVSCLSLSRFRRTLPCVLAALLTLGPCFVLLDTPPRVAPFLVTVFALTVLVLTQNIRRRLMSETFSAGLWAAGLAGLLLGGIVLLWPYEGYEPPLRWEDLAQKMSSIGARIDNRANITAGLSGNPDRVDLDNLPWLPGTNITELYVTAERSEYLYLRGMSYNSFDGESWRIDKSQDWEPNCLLPGLDTVQNDSNRILVETTSVHDVLYVPYSFCGALPDGGRVVSDAYVANRGRLKEYQVRSGALRDQEDVSYYLWGESNCLSVPEQTKQAVLAWWADHGVFTAEQLDRIGRYQAAQTVALAVSNVASYSRRPDKRPRDRDFCEWFLNEAETGYCVHYATVTVALLRSLGIPARYATGYVCQTRAGTKMTVTSLQAHAWPEIFVSGQWVPVEPTPGEATEFSGTIPVPVSPQNVPDEPETRPTSVPDEPETEEPDFTRPDRPRETREITDPDEPTQPGETETPKPGDPETGPDPEAEPLQLPSWLWYPLGALALAGLAAGQRRLRLNRFARRLSAAAPNERAALIWRRYARLCALSRSKTDPAAETLARKAAFSQHELDEQELLALRERLERQENRLRLSAWYKKLWYRYALAVI